MPVSPELAFDVRLYDSAGRGVAQATADLTSLVMSEAVKARPEERIFPYSYRWEQGQLLTEDGWNTRIWERDNPEVARIRQMAEQAAAQARFGWFIHISPPTDEWPEDRVTLGRVQPNQTEVTIQCYGGPTGWSETVRQEVIERLGLAESDGRVSDQIFVCWDDWSQVGEIIPELRSWWRQTASAVSRRQRLEPKIRQTVAARLADQAWQDPVSVGAQLEQTAARIAGVELVTDGRTGCGVLNSGLLPIWGPGPQFLTRTWQEWERIKRWFGRFVYSCGKCGASIMKKIYPGHQCLVCGGVYHGC